MADCRIVGKIYPGAVRCNCVTGTRIFCAGFLYIHISHSSVCIRLQAGSWADTLRCDSGFSKVTRLCVPPQTSVTWHCAPPVLRVLWFGPSLEWYFLQKMLRTRHSCVKQAQEGKWLQENWDNKIINLLGAAGIFTLLLSSWQLWPLKQHAYVIVWKCGRF